eukprot:scaffold85648_cov40-Tisochrysis_lutea.AAC.1
MSDPYRFWGGKDPYRFCSYRSLYDYNYTMIPFICPHCNTLDHPYYVYYGVDGDGNVACSRAAIVEASQVDAVKDKCREGGFGSWKVQRKFLGAPSKVHAQGMVDEINELVSDFLDDFKSLALRVARD